MFQFSRRKLLAKLVKKIDLDPDDEQTGEPTPEARRRKDDLTRAAKAADEQIRSLEYWSDIRRTVREGESYGATDADQGWGEGWEGVDESGPGARGDDGSEPE